MNGLNPSQKRPSRTLLHLLDDGGDAVEQRVRLVKTRDLGSSILGGVLLEDLGEFNGLIIALDILEAERHLDGAEEGIDLLAALGKLGSRTNEPLLAGELSERGT